MKPETLTDFRRLGKKRRQGRKAETCKELHDSRKQERERERREQKRSYYHGYRCWPKYCIPLGQHTIDPTDHRRAKNWLSPHPTTYASEAIQYNEGLYSSRCTWTKYAYRQYIESWGIIVGRSLRYTIDTGGETQTRLLGPYRGWHWRVDANGIVLVDRHGQRDYHPTAADLLATRSTSDIAKIARRKAEERKANQKLERETQAAIRKAEREGAYVCLVDSVRAGNCRAGTENWARRHKLNPRRHYKPSEILASANGDASRVQLVVSVALRRHKQELRQGFCSVADHYV